MPSDRTDAPADPRPRVELVSATITQRDVGAGDPLVFLHAETGLGSSGPLLDALADRRRVLAPAHPGWGVSPGSTQLRSVEDLSYVYLDYLDAVTDGPVPVVGTSLGAWLAVAVAVKSCARISALVLVSPVGIKIGGREDRDFVDLFACSPEEAARALHGPSGGPDLSRLGREALEELAAGQEATARVAWEPYLHDPHLVHRLHRIAVPTLVVWDRDDRLVRQPASYYDAYCRAIGDNASAVAMHTGAHHIDEVAPGALADVIVDFLRGVGV